MRVSIGAGQYLVREIRINNRKLHREDVKQIIFKDPSQGEPVNRIIFEDNSEMLTPKDVDVKGVKLEG